MSKYSIIFRIKNLFVYLILGVLFFLNGCASYKAEPLEDFTESNDSSYERQGTKKSDNQWQTIDI